MKRGEIVEQTRKPIDVSAHAARAAVPAVIERVHGAAARCEPDTEIFVAAAVLTETVHHEQHTRDRVWQPRAAEQREPIWRRERSFDSAQRRAHLRLTPRSGRSQLRSQPFARGLHAP